MEKIRYSVDLISLQCLCFYSPCHSQVENFLPPDSEQQAHRSPGSQAGSLQLEGFPPFSGTREGGKALRNLPQTSAAGLDVLLSAGSSSDATEATRRQDAARICSVTISHLGFLRGCGLAPTIPPTAAAGRSRALGPQ